MGDDDAAAQRNSGFDEMYRDTPPWEIGRPQPFVVDAIANGAVQGRVLDVGCGTGHNAMAAAHSGADVTGIDVSPRAIEKAHTQAAELGLNVRFQVADVFAFTPEAPFDTVIDSGVFHIFPDDDRARYVARLRDWVRPGGRLLLACFSDREPTDWGGPRRISRRELDDAFGDWAELRIAEGRYHVRLEDVTGHAWVVHARR